MKSILLSLLFLTGVFTAAEPPNAIQSYYGRAAFLATYSTPVERSNCALLTQIGVAPQGSRLLKVARSQKLNAKMIQKVDPGMPTGRKFLQAPEGYIALAEIVECEATETTVRIKLRSHELPTPAVARFTAHYDEVAGDPLKLPSLDERLALSKTKVAPVTIHHWVLTSDGWRKQEGDWQLLSR